MASSSKSESGNNSIESHEKLFPSDRILTIMKSSPGVSDVTDEALYLTSKATEKFISHLARSAYAHGKNKKILEYEDVSDVVQSTDVLEFIREIMPKKITYLEYKQIMEKKRRGSSTYNGRVENSKQKQDRQTKGKNTGGTKGKAVAKGKATNSETKRNAEKEKLEKKEPVKEVPSRNQDDDIIVIDVGSDDEDETTPSEPQVLDNLSVIF